MDSVGARYPAAASLALALLVALPAFFATPAYGQADEAPSPAAAARWNVGLHNVPRDLDVGDTWQGAEVVRVNRVLRQLTVLSSQGGFVSSADDDANVVFIEPDLFEQWVEYVPNDPRYGDQYAPDRIQADLAWDSALGTPDVNVCIVDTGVRSTHEDISGSRWLGGYDFVNNDASPSDDQGHGTHVAGIAAATTNNAKGIAGIAQVGIKAAKVLDSTGSGSHSDVADGIEWCASNDGHVINLSLGGSGSTTMKNAIEYAWDAGSLIVAAAGNDGPCSNCVGYPAAYADVIAVSCTTSSNAQCSFSSDGPQIDLAGPGYDILSTCYGSNTQYCYKSGTSMSAPNVAGVAALVWSTSPLATNADIRAALETTAKDLGAAGWDQLYGWGLVDADLAIDALEVIYPQTSILTEAFDDNAANGWTLSGLWRIANLCGPAASAPYYLGFHLAESCSYAETLTASTGAAEFQVDLTDMLQATLHFKHRWETESNGGGAYDLMRVQVSANGGTSWTSIATWDSRDANQASWKDETFLLNDHVGGVRSIRFWFDSVDLLSNAYDGWHIDNLDLAATDNFPPVARAGPDIVVSDADATGSQAATMDGTGSHDLNAGGSIVSHQWYLGTSLLGSGPTATLSLPVGANTVRLVVTDNQGATNEDAVLVTVNANIPPVADAGMDQSVGDPDASGDAAVTLFAGLSADADGTLVDYAWTEGSTALATGAAPALTLPVGVHDITLTVTDNGGATDTDVVRIDVSPNAPPIAEPGPALAASDRDGDGEAIIHLDGSASADPDGTIVAYAWTLAGSPVASTAQANVALPRGSHTLTLRVEDDGGAFHTADLAVEIVADLPPVPSFGWSCAGLDCTFDASPSTDDGTIMAYAWSFGDGATDVGIAPAHTYPADDGYTVCLTATDDAGLFSSHCNSVSVGTLLFHADFDDGTAGGMTLSGLWHVSALCTAPPSPPKYLGYHRSTVCNYDTGTNSGNAVLRVDLSDTVDPKLHFHHRWQTQSSSSYDKKTIQVKPATSSTWTTLKTFGGGSQTAWTPYEQSLAAYVGQTMDVRFRFDTITSSSNSYAGWHIDVVQVGEPADLLLPDVPPVARAGPDVTLGDADGNGSAAVGFDASASTDGDGTIVSYLWTDGATTLATTSVFSAELAVGVHTITLKVTDNDGDTGTDTLVVTVLANRAPVADAGTDATRADADQTGAERVTLSAVLSSDPDGPLVDYTWTDGAFVLGIGPVADVELALGTHHITLTVEDEGGRNDTDDVIVTVTPNGPPSADAGPDLLLRDVDGTGDEPALLSGVGSTDPDGELASYAWTEGPTLLGMNATLPVLLPVGTHTLTLTVTDAGGLANADDVVVTVAANVEPVAAAGFDVVRNDDDQDGFEQVTLDGRGSVDPDGMITAYTWTAGATTLATGAVATVPFPVGVHIVTLEVVDQAGARATDLLTVTITDNRPPVPAFSVTCSAVTCQFDAGATTDPDGDALTLAWNFGDGGTATDAVLAHAYPGGGLYTPCLTASDAGFSITVCQNLHIIALHFVETFDDGAAQGWTLEGMWHVDDACASPPSGPNYLGYHHNLVCMYQALGTTMGGARFNLDLRQATVATLEFQHRWVTETTTPPTERDEMKLQVSTNGGSSWTTLRKWDSADANQPQWARYTANLAAYAGKEIQIQFHFDSETNLFNHYEGWYVDDVRVVSDGRAPQEAPTAAFSAACDDYVCAFDAGASEDEPYGAIAGWAWQFGDGTTGSGATPTHNYTANGTYTVRLVVTDNQGGTDDATAVVTATGVIPVNQAPDAAFSVQVDGLAVTVDGSVSTDPDGDALAFAWRFGDGGQAEGTPAGHTYAADGTYTITLTVNDGALSDETSVEVTVSASEPVNNAPHAVFTFEVDALTASFDAAGSNDPDGDPLAFAWTFGDGGSGSGVTVSHAYASPGTYTVALTVTDDENAVGTAGTEVVVTGFPDITGPPAAPPPDPHVPDSQPGVAGDALPAPWMNVESAWFAADADQLFVGMKVEDVVSTDRTTAFVAYRVFFAPTWTIPDKTFGGRVPAGETPKEFEARAHYSPVGQPGSAAMLFTLWVRTENAAFQSQWRNLGTQAGAGLDLGTDILWWPIPRALVQAPFGSTLTATSAVAGPSVNGVTSVYGPMADFTGPGSEFTF